MKLSERKQNRLKTYDYSQNGAYFITICTRDRRKILSSIVGPPLPGWPLPQTSRDIHSGVSLLPYGVIAEKYICQLDAFYPHLSVDRYVIMPDHIHFLISVQHPDGHPGRGVPTERNSLIAQFVGTFKRFCNREYGENIWQARYYDHIIRNQQDYNAVWEYIENNPAKWAETKGT